MRIPTPSTPTTRREIDEHWKALEAVKVAITKMADGYTSAQYNIRQDAESAASVLEVHGWETNISHYGTFTHLEWVARQPVVA